MANDENTAVNDLIARVHGGPSSSAPGGAGQAHPMHTSRPVQMPVAAPFDPPAGPPAGPPPGYPAVPRPLMSPALPQRGPTDPSMVAFGPAQLGSSGPMGSAGSANAHSGPSGPWAATVPLNAPRPPRSRNQEHMVGTIRVSRRSERQVLFSKLVVPMALLVVVGMLAGGWVAIHGERSASRTHRGSAAKPATEAGDPAPTATPEPAIAPAAAPTAVAPAAVAPAAVAPVAVAAATVVPAVTAPSVVPAPASDPSPAAVPAVAPPVSVAQAAALVDVRIDSTPRGATVTLVDHGKTQLVGNTPISAAFDPTREYDLVFTYPSKPTRVEHFHAGTTRRISVALDPAAPAVPETTPVEPPPPAVAPAPTPAPAPVHRAEPASAHRAAARAEAGDGTLMISTKPPCEIVIDGRSTGLTTPQKAIALPAGSHRITLINADKDIKKTVSVQIEAHETEKLIEDFLK